MVMGELAQETELLVIGGGPGGYAAAFRAADLGMDVSLVDIAERPGGVCLFRGCIPSKTFLYVSELIHDAERAERMGLNFGQLRIDLVALRNWKDQVIDRLADGLVSLSDQRGVQLIRGRAVFEGPDKIRLHDSEVSHVNFKHCILASGSRPVPIPGTPFRKMGRIINSTGALDLTDIPPTMMVVGGGYVGLELGSVYAALGSRVTVAEMGDRLLPGTDPDLVIPLQRRLEELFEDILLNTRVTGLEENTSGADVRLATEKGETLQRFDRVLVAIGRKPNSANLRLDAAGVDLDARGYVIVDEKQRTSNPKIFAVGDVAGGLQLAHKATYEGKIAAEVIAGQPSASDARAIPAVVYTDPQIAFCGLTEEAARQQGIKIEVRRFPWKFSGRATTMDTPEGLTKMIVEPETERILGMGIVGRNTEGMISEAVLAIEMGALARDVALSIHPHPTLSETQMEVAEIFSGSATHILSKKKT